MMAQVCDCATRLIDLPKEVLGMICSSLSLKDRLSLSTTCSTLLHGLASSPDAWGMLKLRCVDVKMPILLAWLAHRRQGLRHLELTFSIAPIREDSEAAAQLAACLGGSPLAQLLLCNMNLSGMEGCAGLQRLGSCSALTSLTLENCGLCCLPSVLEQLTTLAELSLPRNKLEGASWGRLRQLAALTRLDISICGLAALPAELAALPALAALELEQNPVLGAAAEEAWAPLAQCSSLASLGLGSMGFKRLPLALAGLALHLVDLSLRYSFLEGLNAGSESILGPLYRLTGLTRLSLSNCPLGHPLPEELSCLGALRDLHVSYSYIPEEGLEHWPLRHVTALTRLSFRCCNLTELPEEISHLRALSELDLGFNPHLKAGLSWQCLRTLTALTLLNLSACNLERLPPELAELHSLAELNLSRNSLLGYQFGWNAVRPAARWAALRQLSSLTCLRASCCELRTVPAVFAALPVLRVLCLAGNPGLSRIGVDRLRPLVGMTTLQRLDLSECNLPRELELDALPFPLHRLEGRAEQTMGFSDDLRMLRLWEDL